MRARPFHCEVHLCIDTVTELPSDSELIGFHGTVRRRSAICRLYQHHCVLACRAVQALALQRMLEEDLYFAWIYCAWQRDDVFDAISPILFSPVPAALRPLLATFVRSSLLRDIHGQVRRRLSRRAPALEWRPDCAPPVGQLRLHVASGPALVRVQNPTKGA